ncbi:MAG: hypothetical protein JXB13_12255 [Phycisphaerae bacterium]|nr:hypothetical protein [Phycisphaerae bacterium]
MIRYRLVRAAGLCLLTVPGPGASSLAVAADVPESLREGVRGDRDGQSLDSLDFILSIGLSRDQARAILPLYVQACAAHVRRHDEKAEIQPQEVQAYAAFLAEDRLNQGFSPEVEHRTARIHGRAKQSRESHAVQLNALAEQVEAVLSPSQLRVVEYYRPQRKAVFAQYAGPKEKRKQARDMMRRVRHAPPARRPDDPVMEAYRAEIDEINRFVHPRPETLATYLLAPSAARWLYELAGMSAPAEVYETLRVWQIGTPEYPLARCEQDARAIRELSKRINNWNLTNGMYFSPGQMEQLVALADRTERLKAAQREARPRDKLHPVVLDARLVELELAAERVLRPAQREVLKEYKPCLLPPKNLKDPVRVGQARDDSHLAQWLERARGRDEQAVTRMVDRLIEGEIAHLGPMDENVRNTRRQLLTDTVRLASSMTDVEFALNQQDLVDSIQPPDRKEELTALIEELKRTRIRPGRTHDYLLNRDFAAVLAERHRQLTSAHAPGARKVAVQRNNGENGDATR